MKVVSPQNTMYGLWTSVLILIMTYPGYLVWKPPGDYLYSGVVKSFYHLILFIIAQGPAFPRYMKTPSGGLIALSTFYWIFFFLAAIIKFYYFRPIETAIEQALTQAKKAISEVTGE